MIRITVVPAYGRDYNSQKAVEADWVAGKDFTISDTSSKWNGAKINLEDAFEGGIAEVNVRYSNLRKVHVIKVESA